MNSTTVAEQIQPRERTVRLISPGRLAITQPDRKGNLVRTAYLFVRTQSEIGGQGFRLFKIGRTVNPGGTVSLEKTKQIDVLINGKHSTCDCEDGTYRGHQRPCKHVAALQVLIDQGKLS